MQLQKIFVQILYINRSWTMLTQFNCQSATNVKNTVIFYYIHAILHTLFFNAMHVSLFCPYFYAKVALSELLEEPHQPVSNFLRDLLTRRNLCTAASRESGLAAMWYVLDLLWWSTRCSFLFYLCSVVHLRVYGYILNTLPDLI